MGASPATMSTRRAVRPDDAGPLRVHPQLGTLDHGGGPAAQEGRRGLRGRIGRHRAGRDQERSRCRSSRRPGSRPRACAPSPCRSSWASRSTTSSPSATPPGRTARSSRARASVCTGATTIPARRGQRRGAPAGIPARLHRHQPAHRPVPDRGAQAAGPPSRPDGRWRRATCACRPAAARCDGWAPDVRPLQACPATTSTTGLPWSGCTCCAMPMLGTPSSGRAMTPVAP